jgi:hypothetical protein
MKGVLLEFYADRMFNCITLYFRTIVSFALNLGSP